MGGGVALGAEIIAGISAVFSAGLLRLLGHYGAPRTFPPSKKDIVPVFIGKAKELGDWVERPSKRQGCWWQQYGRAGLPRNCYQFREIRGFALIAPFLLIDWAR
jgi:hypothetical protein